MVSLVNSTKHLLKTKTKTLSENNLIQKIKADSCCSVAQSRWLFATPWIALWQTSLSSTISQSLLKLISIESVMPFNHLILCHPLLLLSSIFPSIGSFPMSQLFPTCGQSIGASASASVLPINIQGWFPLGWTGLISLLSRLSRVFSSTTVQKHQFFDTKPSLWSSSQIFT